MYNLNIIVAMKTIIRIQTPGLLSFGHFFKKKEKKNIKGKKTTGFLVFYIFLWLPVTKIKWE